MNLSLWDSSVPFKIIKDKTMKTTIIGHNINIIGLEDFDYTKGNDSFIYEINDSILAGDDSGEVEVLGCNYSWEVIPEIDNDEYENLCYENKKMGEFLAMLGLTPDDITSLIINGDAQQKAKALKKAKAPIEFKLNFNLTQKLLDLLNGKLFHSDTSFTHDSDKTRIFIEIGNDLDDEEFKDGYKSLKEILGVSNLDTFIFVDY